MQQLRQYGTIDHSLSLKVVTRHNVAHRAQRWGFDVVGLVPGGRASEIAAPNKHITRNTTTNK